MEDLEYKESKQQNIPQPFSVSDNGPSLPDGAMDSMTLPMDEKLRKTLDDEIEKNFQVINTGQFLLLDLSVEREDPWKVGCVAIGKVVDKTATHLLMRWYLPANIGSPTQQAVWRNGKEVGVKFNIYGKWIPDPKRTKLDEIFPHEISVTLSATEIQIDLNTGVEHVYPSYDSFSFFVTSRNRNRQVFPNEYAPVFPELFLPTPGSKGAPRHWKKLNRKGKKPKVRLDVQKEGKKRRVKKPIESRDSARLEIQATNDHSVFFHLSGLIPLATMSLEPYQAIGYSSSLVLQERETSEWIEVEAKENPPQSGNYTWNRKKAQLPFTSVGVDSSFLSSLAICENFPNFFCQLKSIPGIYFIQFKRKTNVISQRANPKEFIDPDKRNYPGLNIMTSLDDQEKMQAGSKEFMALRQQKEVEKQSRGNGGYGRRLLGRGRSRCDTSKKKTLVKKKNRSSMIPLIFPGRIFVIIFR